MGKPCKAKTPLDKIQQKLKLVKNILRVGGSIYKAK
jgi:hypothetical protein